MEIASKATGVWTGGLSDGAGTVALGSGNGEFAVTWKARSAGQSGATTPEELLAAAHASCFSMALSHALEGNGTPPQSLEVGAEVTFEAGKGVTGSTLSVRGAVPGLDQAGFSRFAEEAKAGCPISQALAGVPISLAEATLVG